MKVETRSSEPETCTSKPQLLCSELEVLTFLLKALRSEGEGLRLKGVRVASPLGESRSFDPGFSRGFDGKLSRTELQPNGEPPLEGMANAPSLYCLAIATFANAFSSSSVSWIILPDTSKVTLNRVPANLKGGW